MNYGIALRFNQLGSNQVVKDKTNVQCINDLIVDSGVDNDVSFHLKYRICATVNHSGTLNAGHYTAFVKENTSSIETWSLCNDKAVTKSKRLCVDNDSIIYFLPEA